MKKTNYLILALLSLIIIITGCSEDNILRTIPATPGTEIDFGANASYENGNAQTRTIYGDKGNGFQIINWEVDDHIRIVCAQAAQHKEADYKLSSITHGQTNGDKESNATILTKLSNGLQWGQGEHTFYAVYPSPYIFENQTGTDQPKTTISNHRITGILPVVQTIKEMKENVVIGNNTYKYVAMPNMDNAYMVARANYNTETNGGDGVELHFKPIVTAIEIEIKAGDINLNSVNNSLTLTGVSLRSASGKDICGSFAADITNLNTDEDYTKGLVVTDTNDKIGEHNRVTIELNNKNVVLEKDQSCVVTFFLLPTTEFNDNNTDLTIDIFYTCNGVSTTRSCILGKEIKAHKKYFFSNLTLPSITPNTNSSNWFSLIDDEIYLSQISIPAAGNTASYNYNGSNSSYYKEQTLSIEEQWNLGIRCFELISERQNTSTSNLNNRNLTCNSTSVGITYGAALTTLTNLLKDNEGECLIIISSYQPGDSYVRNCQTYMDNLANTFNSGSYNGVNIVKWEPSSTAGDVRNKMTIIGRVSQEGEDATVALNNVPSWLTYIEGWGSLKDKWNRRFGNEFYPGYNQSFNMGARANVEPRLFRFDSNTYPSTTTYPTSSPDFHYNLSGGGQAWVQEWMRVSPGVDYLHLSASTSGNHSLYIHWPNSNDEKYNNIIETFDKSKAETGNMLYINSLCGYFVDANIVASFSPYLARSYTMNGYTFSNNLNGGQGGNFYSYNTAMNERIYDYVLTQSQANTTGPMGIVIMDYIGNGNGGTYLPSLIYQNNFKFPLKKKQ